MSIEEMQRMLQWVCWCMDEHAEKCNECECEEVVCCPEYHRLLTLYGVWDTRIRAAQQQSGITRVRNQWGAWQ